MGSKRLNNRVFVVYCCVLDYWRVLLTALKIVSDIRKEKSKVLLMLLEDILVPRLDSPVWMNGHLV